MVGDNLTVRATDSTDQSGVQFHPANRDGILVNFTVGYIYRTRDDQDVRILATDAKGERPICGLLDYDSLGMEGALMWHSDGSYGTSLNDLDLVVQITQETIPQVPIPEPPPIWNWGTTCPWFNYLVKYPSGKWALSETRPHRNGQGWRTEPRPLVIPVQFNPQIQVPWEHSTMERS